jgi:hypothetical protein
MEDAGRREKLVVPSTIRTGGEPSEIRCTDDEEAA